MISNPFTILQIPEKATTQEIQKAFRKLAFKYHPDTSKHAGTNEIFTQLYEAYREAMQQAEKQEQTDFKNLDSQFKKTFGINLFEISNENEVFRILLFLFSRMQDFFYKSDKFNFFKKVIKYFLTKSDKIPSKELKNYFEAISRGLFLLISARIDTHKKTHLQEEEFKLDRVRKEFCNYIDKIIKSSNYLDLRMNINSPKEPLLNIIIDYLRKTREESYFMELSALVLIITSLEDENFYNEWFEAIQTQQLK